MKIGVVGWGVVGKATAQAFRDVGRHTVKINDVRDIKPEKNYWLSELAETAEVIFVCVPTPRCKDGSADISAVVEVVSKLDHYRFTGLVAVKSTVPPLTTVGLQASYPSLRIACCPEFLRANSAYEDSLLPDRIVCGADKKDFETLAQVYTQWTCPQYYCTPTEAELIKYLSNACLTARVAFACEIKRICDIYKADIQSVYEGVSSDKRIGTSHLNPAYGPVPQSSPCLPKDLSALIAALELQGYASDFLKIVEKLGVKQNGK